MKTLHLYDLPIPAAQCAVIHMRKMLNEAIVNNHFDEAKELLVSIEYATEKINDAEGREEK